MLGIHRINIGERSSSYFIERPFGNYLAFSDNMDEIPRDFLKAKGGVYKQFIESSSNIDSIHGKIFDLYGASSVGFFQTEIFHPLLPIERFGIDFDDPAVEFGSHGVLKWLLINQRGERVAIMGEEFELTEGPSILEKAKGDQTSKWLAYFKDLSLGHIFFSKHGRENFIFLK